MENDAKRFIRKSVVISCILAVVLSAAAYVLWLNLPEIYENNIVSLSKSGKVDTASDKLNQLQLITDDIDPALLANCKYAIAQGLYNEKRFSESMQIFGELGDYSDSSVMINACKYSIAQQYFEQGDYLSASEQFFILGSYSDSSARYNECLYNLALESYSRGEYSEAISQLIELGDFPNAYEKALEIAIELTGNENTALEMISTDISAEEMDLIIGISAAKEQLKIGMIAAGGRHTAALFEDGTVDAVGSNEFGQCNVKDWRNIVYLAAGSDFTLGLKADGTVVAAGNNKYGQCDVSQWQNVRSIAASSYDSFAVTADGRLLACGQHKYDDLLSLEGVTDVFAGSYQAACLLEDGRLISSNISSSTALKPVSVALTTAMSVNVMANGTVSSSFEELPQWKNVVYVTANSRGVLGITADGEVESFFFRSSDKIAFDLSGVKTVAASAGGGHYVFLADDGTVRAFGDNKDGQCNVGSWDLW